MGDDAAARIARRRGVPRLAQHLSEAYGTEVTGIDQLDLGVYRVDRADGDSWVARLFPTVRARHQVDGDAEAMRWLEALGYPAERLAAADPVSVLEDQPLIVTEYVTPVPRAARRDAIIAAGGLRALGYLLGRLHTEQGSPARTGGAWHHLADGEPGAEAAALARLVQGAADGISAREQRRYEAVRDAVDQLDTGQGLPVAFTHPDFVMANVVAAGDGSMVVVDWSGAGRAPRMWSLGFLLWSVGLGGDLGRVDRVVAGYRRRVRPESEELSRLDGLVAARPVTFQAWAFAMGRAPLAEVARSLPGIRKRAAAVAARARAGFGES